MLLLPVVTESAPEPMAVFKEAPETADIQLRPTPVLNKPFPTALRTTDPNAVLACPPVKFCKAFEPNPVLLVAFTVVKVVFPTFLPKNVFPSTTVLDQKSRLEPTKILPNVEPIPDT